MKNTLYVATAAVLLCACTDLQAREFGTVKAKWERTDTGRCVQYTDNSTVGMYVCKDLTGKIQLGATHSRVTTNETEHHTYSVNGLEQAVSFSFDDQQWYSATCATTSQSMRPVVDELLANRDLRISTNDGNNHTAIISAYGFKSMWSSIKWAKQDTVNIPTYVSRDSVIWGCLMPQALACLTKVSMLALMILDSIRETEAWSR